MTQPDVALTDYALALECLIFVYFLVPSWKRSRFLTFCSIGFFLTIALAGVLGGTTHGFYEEETSAGYKILWSLTMLSIGATALSGTGMAAAIHLGVATARTILRAATAVFLVYCVVVLFFKNDFVVAIVDYFPVVLFLGWAFLAAYRRTRRTAFRQGFLGICVMLVAAAVQQARIGIHPRYFNHNAVYHVLQAIGQFMVFIATRDACSQSEVHQP